MTDASEIMAQMKKAHDSIKRHDDDLLRAIAMVAAQGGMRIIPTADDIFGESVPPIISMPRRMYDRMVEIIPTEGEPK